MRAPSCEEIILALGGYGLMEARFQRLGLGNRQWDAGLSTSVEMALSFLPEAVQVINYNQWGSDKTYAHMAAPWAWAFDTPFKWTKQITSHFGGTRQGMAISWPGRIKDVGGIRTQFHHVIDIVPTILEATGIPAPDVVDGIPQKPIEGVSMMYTFDAANANAPSTRTRNTLNSRATVPFTTTAGLRARRRRRIRGTSERAHCPM